MTEPVSPAHEEAEMKAIVCIIVLFLVLFPGISMPVYAGHVRADIWLGPVWGPWWGMPLYQPYPYYPYPQAPVVIEREPQIYVQPAPQQQEEQNYWYFCREADKYYPYVKQCPGGWLKVIPSTIPPDEVR